MFYSQEAQVVHFNSDTFCHKCICNIILDRGLGEEEWEGGERGRRGNKRTGSKRCEGGEAPASGSKVPFI